MFEIIDTEILYDKCENMEELYDKFYYPLLVEYKELKKQLEEKTKIGVADHKYASKCEDKVVAMEAKQQEFINYLKNKRNFYKINAQGYSMSKIEEILQKYKEIVNGDDK